MFNEATFQDILLPSTGNVNDCATYFYRKYTDLRRNNVAELTDLGGENMCNLTKLSLPRRLVRSYLKASIHVQRKPGT